MGVLVVAAIAGSLILLLGLMVWTVGSWVARFLGGLSVISSLISIGTGFGTLSPLVWVYLSAGAVLWLFGHWVWAFKHKLWRSRLALNVYSTALLHRVAPIPTNHAPRRPVPAAY